MDNITGSNESSNNNHKSVKPTATALTTPYAPAGVKVSQEINKKYLLLDRFKILKTYEGGMGKVFVLKDIQNDRLVAAKVAKCNADNFNREARFWIGLGEHENIATAYIVRRYSYSDAWVGDTPTEIIHPCLYMEYFGDGEGNSCTLKQFMGEDVSYAFALKVCLSIVRALKYADSIYPGFVHRDLKPANILVDKDNERIAVTDFGLIKIDETINNMAEEDPTFRANTVSGVTFCEKIGFSGTYGYAAPEQYIDASSLTCKADMFAIGVILHELVAGKLPFSIKDIKTKGIQCFQDPLLINPKIDLPNEFLSLINKLLMPTPNARPTSYEEIEETLKSLYFEAGLKMPEKLPKRGKEEKDVLIGRISSLLALDRELAITKFIHFQKSYPLSIEAPVFINNNFPLEETKRIMLSDIKNPAKATLLLLGFLLLSLPSIYNYLVSGDIFGFFGEQMGSKGSLAMQLILISILYFENYINVRTSITFDKITLIGIIVGLSLNASLGYLNLEPLGISAVASLLYGLLALASLLLFAIIYEAINGSEFIGGGTIKLTTMAGVFLGPLIMPVLPLIICFFILIMLRGDKEAQLVEWKNNRLVHTNKLGNALPSSAFILLAVVLTFALSIISKIYNNLF